MTKHSDRKVFVLDTNVILHDSDCLTHFEEHDVVIPITVLEELDNFKKGNETINFHAREFVRSLDTLGGGKIFNSGVNIGPGYGKVRIHLEQAFHEHLAYNFETSKPNHQILNSAYTLSKQESDAQVILVSKDVNLQMKYYDSGEVSYIYKT